MDKVIKFLVIIILSIVAFMLMFYMFLALISTFG